MLVYITKKLKGRQKIQYMNGQPVLARVFFCTGLSTLKKPPSNVFTSELGDAVSNVPITLASASGSCCCCFSFCRNSAKFGLEVAFFAVTVVFVLLSTFFYSVQIHNLCLYFDNIMLNIYIYIYRQTATQIHKQKA